MKQNIVIAIIFISLVSCSNQGFTAGEGSFISATFQGVWQVKIPAKSLDALNQSTDTTPVVFAEFEITENDILLSYIDSSPFFGTSGTITSGVMQSKTSLLSPFAVEKTTTGEVKTLNGSIFNESVNDYILQLRAQNSIALIQFILKIDPAAINTDNAYTLSLKGITVDSMSYPQVFVQSYIKAYEIHKQQSLSSVEKGNIVGFFLKAPITIDTDVSNDDSGTLVSVFDNVSVIKKNI